MSTPNGDPILFPFWSCLAETPKLWVFFYFQLGAPGSHLILTFSVNQSGGITFLFVSGSVGLLPNDDLIPGFWIEVRSSDDTQCCTGA